MLQVIALQSVRIFGHYGRGFSAFELSDTTGLNRNPAGIFRFSSIKNIKVSETSTHIVLSTKRTEKSANNVTRSAQVYICST